jgi:hypothetical protein
VGSNQTLGFLSFVSFSSLMRGQSTLVMFKIRIG